MLILSRRIGESVVIGENPTVTATVINIQGNQVKIGISAPKDVPVDREEIRRIKKELARKNAALHLVERSEEKRNSRKPPCMSKIKTFYTCQQCGAQFPKWAGQCNDCGQWNTLVEETARSILE